MSSHEKPMNVKGLSTQRAAINLSLDPAMGLADRLRDHTSAWHRRAERSGIVHELLHGRVSRQGYALFMRNLLPAYRQLEAALEQHRDSAGIRHIARPETYRVAAIESDLRALCGTRWQTALPLLPPARDYAEHVAQAAAGEGVRLIAHAYVRYLGDLNGGRIIRQCLMRAPGLEPEALAFYEFLDIQELERFKITYRASFDLAAIEITDVESVIEEAVTAFRLNVEVSEAVAAQ